MSAPREGVHLTRWVTAPSTLSGIVGAGLAVLYGSLTIDLKPDSVMGFVLIAAVFVGIGLVGGDRDEQRALFTLKNVLAGRLPADTEHLSRAVRELFAFPDRAFAIHVRWWIFGAACIALSYALVLGGTWAMAGRLAFLGLALAPVTGLLNYLLLLLRSRSAIERVMAMGLTPTQVIDAHPPHRLQLTRRLMIFTAISVLTPTLMLADLSMHRTTRVVEQMLDRGGDRQEDVIRGLSVKSQVAGGVLVTLLIGVILASGFVAGSALVDPMQRIAEASARVARGELSRTPLVPAEDEVWAASAAFTSMHRQLGDAVGQLKRASLKIASTTQQMSATSSKHGDGALAQASALAETSATTEELARSARQIAENAQDVAQMAQQTLYAAQGGMRSADAFLLSMDKMREGNQAIADSVVRLNKRVQQIGKIVEFINGIADKSDLLALNAELEGTKAGEVGRGFSLVAAEMRRLAESVMRSTREIARLIEEIRDATNAAVMATEAGVKATDRGSTLAQKVTESLKVILDFAAQTTDAARSISLATQQQQSGPTSSPR